MANNTSKRRCCYCGEMRDWLVTDQRLKDGSKIYVDGDGKRWAGRRCPICEKKRVIKAIRCDRFERIHILDQLREAGYEILSERLPFRVKKDGKPYTVEIRRAFTKEGKVILEEGTVASADLYVLVFESIRILDAAMLAKLGPRLLLASPSTLSGLVDAGQERSNS